MGVVKGVAGGMVAGAVVGIAGKTMLDKKPKVKKKANKAIKTMGELLDTAQYMFK
jgi:hypothetical protein